MCRGGSCGWAICPALGHSAVALGVVAMRRTGVIAALLGLLEAG